jgi:hypothetical protein
MSRHHRIVKIVRTEGCESRKMSVGRTFHPVDKAENAWRTGSPARGRVSVSCQGALTHLLCHAHFQHTTTDDPEPSRHYTHSSHSLQESLLQRNRDPPNLLWRKRAASEQPGVRFSSPGTSSRLFRYKRSDYRQSASVKVPRPAPDSVGKTPLVASHEP